MPTPSDIHPSGVFGGEDDTAALQEVLNRCKIAPERVILELPAVYNCSRTVHIRRNPRGLELVGKGGIRRTSLDGGLTDFQDIRTNALVRIEDSTNVALRGITLEGPKTKPGRNRDYEAQHAVWVSSSTDIDLCGLRIRGVMGDGIYLATSKPANDTVPCSNVSVYGNRVDFVGRCGLVANAFEGVYARANTFRDIASSVVDVEAGNTGSHVNNRLFFQDNLIHDTGGLALHLHGGARLEDVYISDNIRQGDPISVECIGPDRPDDPHPFKNINVVRNEWDDAQEGGHFMRYWRCDGVRVLDNRGPIRYTTADQPDFTQCVNVRYNPARNRFPVGR